MTTIFFDSASEGIFTYLIKNQRIKDKYNNNQFLKPSLLLLFKTTSLIEHI